MLTAEDYMRLAERCAVLARECAVPRVAEALRTLALNYLTDATCSASPKPPKPPPPRPPKPPPPPPPAA
jgi:hypothetical protein